MPDSPDPLPDPDATIPVSKPAGSIPRGDSPDLPLPEELTALLSGGNYQVDSFLGQGGMGAVYKGTQVRLKRSVAIKIMRRDQGQDYGFEQRFEREAQAMAKLNHPNIVSVIDYGEAGPNYLYIVMELVNGADLMDVIRTGRMTQEMALTLLPQICDALQFAHDHGIVHRDIKPSNIMLTREGRVKMADFGLAKPMDAMESDFRTQTGTGMGTPDYAAPEQFDAHAQIDHRADIYALGVMIYQMITGQLPRGVWKPPSQRAEIDPGWDDIVSHAMQSDPKDRYQQASEIKTDVSKITPKSTADTPVRTQRPPPQSGANKAADRSVRSTPNRRAPLLFGLIAGTLILALGAFFAFKKPGETPPVGDDMRSLTAVGDDVRSPTSKTGANSPAPMNNGQPGLVTSSPTTNQPPPPSTAGRVIDLLALVDVKRHAIAGEWTRTADGVGVKKAPPTGSNGSRLQLPYEPPEEYDFEIEFTLQPGHEGAAVLQRISSQGRQCAWSLGTKENPVAGFAGVDGKKANRPGNEASIALDPPLQAGPRYRSRVEVRRDSLRGFLDGKELVKWTGDFQRLSLPAGDQWPDAAHLGLHASRSVVTFHKIEVREVTGTGKLQGEAATLAASAPTVSPSPSLPVSASSPATVHIPGLPDLPPLTIPPGEPGLVKEFPFTGSAGRMHILPDSRRMLVFSTNLVVHSSRADG